MPGPLMRLGTVEVIDIPDKDFAVKVHCTQCGHAIPDDVAVVQALALAMGHFCTSDPAFSVGVTES